jgi:hypothetical protein
MIRGAPEDYAVHILSVFEELCWFNADLMGKSLR